MLWIIKILPWRPQRNVWFRRGSQRVMEIDRSQRQRERVVEANGMAYRCRALWSLVKEARGRTDTYVRRARKKTPGQDLGQLDGTVSHPHQGTSCSVTSWNSRWCGASALTCFCLSLPRQKMSNEVLLRNETRSRRKERERRVIPSPLWLVDRLASPTTYAPAYTWHRLSYA